MQLFLIGLSPGCGKQCFSISSIVPLWALSIISFEAEWSSFHRCAVKSMNWSGPAQFHQPHRISREKKLLCMCNGCSPKSLLFLQIKQYSRSNQGLLKELLFQFEATLQSFVQAPLSITSHLTFRLAANSALCNLESVCVHHQIKLPWRAAAKVKCWPALQIEHLKTCSELPPDTFCTRQDFQVFFKR